MGVSLSVGYGYGVEIKEEAKLDFSQFDEDASQWGLGGIVDTLDELELIFHGYTSYDGYRMYLCHKDSVNHDYSAPEALKMNLDWINQTDGQLHTWRELVKGFCSKIGLDVTDEDFHWFVVASHG